MKNHLDAVTLWTLTKVWSLGVHKNPPDRHKTDRKLQIRFYGSYGGHFTVFSTFQAYYY